MKQQKITDDLDVLLAVLPPRICQALEEANSADELLEVVLDLGRLPEARFFKHETSLSDKEISEDDLRYITERIGDFTSDNRAGIERTVHRISAMRNRKGRVVGLTCRVGRAVFGTIDIIQDIVESGESLLILGRPGVGKTTLLREAARILSEQRRVVVVDTSNEIGGDGDIPHPAIGRARRMQVSTPELQHEVMIEAVENHMPQVIIIDEIGRELEAVAARTIAERGVQLIGTAHGNTLDNLLINPTLSDLIGGIQSVTLSDEEARRRGTQKSVLERQSPPTFSVFVEMQDRQRLAVHHNVAAAVDAILRGKELQPEIRYRDEEGQIHIEGAPAIEPVPGVSLRDNGGAGRHALRSQPPVLQTKQIYLYGVGESRLRQAASRLHVPVRVVDNVEKADLVLTLKNYYRKRSAPLSEAEQQGVPVYVLRSNTVNQIESSLVDVFALPATSTDPFEVALEEAQDAIRRMLSGGAPVIELSPQNSAIRRQQHDIARSANLISHSYGREPYRRVRIYRD